MLKNLGYLKAASLMPYSTFERAHLTLSPLFPDSLISSNFQRITILKLSFLIHIKYLLGTQVLDVSTIASPFLR